MNAINGIGIIFSLSDTPVKCNTVLIRAVQKKENMSQSKRRRSKKKDKSLISPNKINLIGEFSTQLESIMAAVSMTQEEIAALNALYTDLETVLKSQWPDCSVIPFGSITTGLAFKTSDVDCFISIPSQSQFQSIEFIFEVKRFLQLYPHLFVEIRAIPRTNMPLVKFYHVPTKTNCDVSFKSPLGTKNSKLLAFLLHADPRIIPIAVAVKYWAKVQALSGTSKLKNYALTMMLIFYLQQPPVSILPSIELLQRDRVNYIIDFWNAGFTEQLPPSSNSSSPFELLGGFFEYYSKFDLDKMVVCPYLGVPIKKDSFKNLKVLPKEFQRYKDLVAMGVVRPLKYTKPLCIQDPFEHSHNLALPIDSKLASNIKFNFKLAADKYETAKCDSSYNFLRRILQKNYI